MSQPNGSPAPPKMRVQLDGGMSIAVFENLREFPNGGKKKQRNIVIQPRRFQDPETKQWRSATGFTPTEAAAIHAALGQVLDAVFALQLQDQQDEAE